MSRKPLSTGADWTFERTCEDGAECGYDGIELPLSAIESVSGAVDEARAVELGRIAERAGLEVVGLHWLLVRKGGDRRGRRWTSSGR